MAAITRYSSGSEKMQFINSKYKQAILWRLNFQLLHLMLLAAPGGRRTERFNSVLPFTCQGLDGRGYATHDGKHRIQNCARFDQIWNGRLRFGGVSLADELLGTYYKLQCFRHGKVVTPLVTDTASSFAECMELCTWTVNSLDRESTNVG